MNKTDEIADKIKNKARKRGERISGSQAISMATAVQSLMKSGISEDYLIEVIAHAVTLENPETYMDTAIMGAYYKTKVENK